MGRHQEQECKADIEIAMGNTLLQSIEMRICYFMLSHDLS